MIKQIEKLVGYRGTKEDIETKIELIISGNDLIIDKSVSLNLFDEDNSVDIGYVFSIDNEYDFDLFVIETREKNSKGETILYISEVTNIN